MLFYAKKALVHAKVHTCLVQSSFPNESPEFGSFCDRINGFFCIGSLSLPLERLSPELKTQHSSENAFFALLLFTDSEIYDHYMQNSVRFSTFFVNRFFYEAGVCAYVPFHFHNHKIFCCISYKCRGRKRKLSVLQLLQSIVKIMHNLNVYLKFQPATMVI